MQQYAMPNIAHPSRVQATIYRLSLFHLVILSCPILHPAGHGPPSPYLQLLYFKHLSDAIEVMLCSGSAGIKAHHVLTCRFT